MGNRRMVSKQIIDTDLFLEMPIGARLLYYDLIVRADDDGFVDSPRKIMKIIGATFDDMRILITKNLVIEFESGIVVITDWRIHNYIQGDRYHPTIYTEEKEQIILNEKTKRYEKINEKPCIQDGYKVLPEVKLSKDKLIKDNININNTICATSETEVAPVIKKELSTPTKYKFPCKSSKTNNNTEWVLSQEDLDWYQETYNNLNIDLELKKMWRWLKENNLKTYQGMGKFVSSWLARANDSYHKNNNDIDTKYKEARIREIELKEKKEKGFIGKLKELNDKANQMEEFLGGKINDEPGDKLVDKNDKCFLSLQENT